MRQGQETILEEDSKDRILEAEVEQERFLNEDRLLSSRDFLRREVSQDTTNSSIISRL